MIGVDLIGATHRAYFEQRSPIKEIVRTLALSKRHGVPGDPQPKDRAKVSARRAVGHEAW